MHADPLGQAEGVEYVRLIAGQRYYFLLRLIPEFHQANGTRFAYLFVALIVENARSFLDISVEFIVFIDMLDCQ